LRRRLEYFCNGGAREVQTFKMPVLIKRKILFLAHPRTASTATSSALCEVGGLRVGKHHHAFMYPPSGEDIVCTIRNPYDVLATWFHLSGYKDVNDFLHEYHHSYMKIGGRLFYFSERSDHFLLYDTLAEDFARLLQTYRLRPQRLYRINTTSKKKPFMSYFNDEAKEFIEKTYAKDLELYRSLRSS
jgi:hypothetical protein